MQRSHDMPFGATLDADGARFSLWAPTASKVELLAEGVPREMAAEGAWFRLDVPGMRAGTLYSYRIDDQLDVPDPASRFQPDGVAGPSMLVDPCAYRWRDDEWQGRPWTEAVLYEVHVGTATPEGSFAALADKLEYLRDLGVTALELMPLAACAGNRNWGYDGVLHYAPNHAYGRPDDLKALVDKAHRLGLMVLLDVVYNHFGPSGNFLHAYAKSFFTERHQTLWGAGINFDGEASPAVRDYFVHNALYWLEEFHFDGLRFDAVHAIADDSERHIIAELAERIRAQLPGRHIHLLLENNANQARWLETGEDGAPRLHTAQWNDDIHHVWHRILTGEADGYYRDYDDPVAGLGRGLAEGFVYQGELSAHDGVSRGEPSGHLPPWAFVNFLQNHDQIGNRAMGERLSTLTAPEKLALARAVLLLAPQIPMLFMGEEWNATAPFQYFVDFPDDPELSEAVREGRRREFASFAGFGSGEAGSELPDPTAIETFERSRPDWAEPAREPHAAILGETKALLRLRQDLIVPLMKSGFLSADWQRPSAEALDVRWRFGGGTLRLVANLGGQPLPVECGSGDRMVWASPVVDSAQLRELPGWTCAILMER
jgi:maltooligosyltrehalose trehalohydrolase